MNEFRWDVTSSIGRLVSTVSQPTLISFCQELLAKQIWTPADRQQLLAKLSEYIPHPQCTLPIAVAFRPILLDLLERAGRQLTTRECFSLEGHERLCIALGRLLTLHPDAYRFLMKYLQTTPPVFERLLTGTSEVKKAKKKKSRRRIPTTTLTDILGTCHRYLEFSQEAFIDLWDWSPILKLSEDGDVTTRWYALRIEAILTNMGDQQTQQLLRHHFTNDDLRQLTIQHEQSKRNEASDHEKQLLLNSNMTFDTDQSGSGTHTMHQLIDADMSLSTVAVCGVLLPVKTAVEKQDNSKTLVRVPSTTRNLHSLALAVSSGTALLLEGAVGCGKSALVDHLAQVTGRRKTPNLMKIQLGDQTDSKALIGTYRCTDIPGEFVWQPGTLTQAVTGGYWIILEDIDYAPMDVVSVLIPLLETGSLSMPGHGDVVRAAPGFQLFATQRLTAGPGGFYRQHVSHAALLDRLWSKVNVEPLSREELQQVVMTLHPKLTSIADKLLDIFCMLSSGSHEGQDPTMENTKEQHGRVVTPAEFIGHQGRLISTRDLLKWCGRVAASFDASQVHHSANQVFMEAMDCFCAVLPKPKTRSAVAEAIGVRLNLSLEKCSFFIKSYKPNIDIQQKCVTVGRARLSRKEDDMPKIIRPKKSRFAFTRQASILLERVTVCINNNEPVLLVGETGTGKTSAVQYLADLTGQRLKVINMNQQSDSTDLLGGFKPVDFKQLVSPLREEFEALFLETFSRKQNVKFLIHLQECFSLRRWQDLLKLIGHCQQAAMKRFEKGSHDEEAGSSSGKESPAQRLQWRSIGERVLQLKTQLQHSENALAFSFVEGTLVQAVRNGDWVLLDEINLATAETLECLSGLLESTQGTVTLLERGDLDPIVRHKKFRLFACMNPATDVGKKELPPGIRNRFTEFYVDELEERQDLKILVSSYLQGLSLSADKLEGIVQFYLAVRKEAHVKLADGTGHRPHYSLRTLCRALRYAATNPCGGVMRSLYESFCLSFLTQLDRASHPLVEQLIVKKLIGRANVKSILSHPIPPPTAGMFVKVEGYWIGTGDGEPVKQKGYVMTASVRANMRDLARIVSAGSFPVLLQGETSVGKTSLIQYLAQATGNHCVRVNNHEHTDLQEYVGFYAADETGKLVFKEGVLVDAMRKGHWIILDELNLAPSDVLEALNRLLDDNRELFIAETQEMVSAHPRFMLFATQNPPGQYGGRKVLSRAFRNRFVELHFDEIPSKELQTILHERCAIPLSYCKKMVAVMLDLQTRRKGSGVFSGKQGFITLRDLFRWAERYRRASQGHGTLYDWDQHIADDGYLLLAGRVRRSEEQSLIKEVLEKHIRCKVDPSRLFSLSADTSPITRGILERVLGQGSGASTQEEFSHIVWTLGMRRLAVLVGRALMFQEPVLLVGETGCGKTTICQLHAALSNQKLYSVNCHLHTETSDFLGGLRPVRQHSDKAEDKQKLFEWCDGPLVLAMRENAAFLIDEISLADDSVLERLNSVLEPERTLLLAERGSGESQGDDIDMIVAAEEFFVVATMNPGGDFGKKELSPALRNRFTEIWCPQSNDRQDLVNIIEHNLAEGVWLCNQEDGSSGVGNAIMEFIGWFQSTETGKRCTISIRDILSWVNFINTCCNATQLPDERHSLDSALSYVHGACMVFLDGLGSGSTSNSSVAPGQARLNSLNFLRDQIWRLVGQEIDLTSLMVTSDMRSEAVNKVYSNDVFFGMEPFYILRGPLSSQHAQDHYALNAPTTALNAQRVLRALQLPRAILLEGSPGVGKTSLVSAIAKASGHELVRINLSEQTDVTDLFGADLPVEGGEGGQFAWRDGPLLTALKGGHWVVLDELNLASQSVLEGLNACLDHRAEVYVPELGKTFHIQHDKTRLFACQNPLKQGGGRKGLPRSFLNRFTQVYVEPLTPGDLLFIAHSMYPMLKPDLLEKMVAFNNQLYHQTMVEFQWGQRGGPWEFNLRDLFRWCDLMVHDQHGRWQPGQHVGLIYRERMRTQKDKEKVQELFQSVFGDDYTEVYEGSRQVHITPVSVQVGHSFLRRVEHIPSTPHHHNIPLQLLHHSLDPIESLMKCIEMNWMTIMVGPTASGKTSLVHLIGHLTGHKVRVLAMNSSMDTTELLGGFEQADLNRHWEKALQSLRSVVMTTARLLLLAAEKKVSQHATKLLANWAALGNMCSQVGAGDSSASSIEGLTERKLDMSSQVLDLTSSLAQNHTSEPELCKDILHVTNTIAQLRVRLEKEGRTIQQGGGGKFEWVDGLLVQALKEGDWLLIDNVNFCSPSVLDRLNALLEPNGVLSINERGVIDGHIPTIKPHPDFRLILAMDPRHGEISRAMRNRGVEIYILGETEGGSYKNLDLLALLSGVGLAGNQLTGTLMRLHEDIKCNMPGCDVSSLPSLLLAASVTMQLLERGRDTKSALNQACMDVYVSGQLSKVNKQKSQEIVTRHLAVLEVNGDLAPADSPSSPSTDEEDGPSIEGVLHPRHLPSVVELSCNAPLAMMRRDGSVFMYLLDQAESLSDKSEAGSQAFIPLIKPATLLLMEQATPTDWELRRDWLLTTWNEWLPGNKEVIDREGKEFAKYMPEIIRVALGEVCRHPLCQQLLEIADTFEISEAFKMLKYYPLDLNLAPHLVAHLDTCRQQRAPDRMDTDDECDSLESVHSQFDEAVAIARRLYLVLLTTVNRFIEESKLKHAVDVRHKPTTAIQLSYALNKGVVAFDDLPHPLVAHLYPFFKTLDSFLSEAISTANLYLTEEATYQILLAFQWRDRCWLVCDRPIKGKDSFHLGQFELHWQWLVKNFIQVVPNLLLGDDVTLPQNLHAIIHRIIDHLAIASTLTVTEHQRALQHHMGHPLPYKTSLSADTSQHLLKLGRVLDVLGVISRVDVNRLGTQKRRKFKRSVRFVVRDSGLTCQNLLQLMNAVGEMNSQALEYVDDELLDSIQGVEASLAAQGIHSQDGDHPVAMETDEDNNHSDNNALSDVASRVGLWPVCEHFALCAEQAAVNKLLAFKVQSGEIGQVGSVDGLQSMVAFTSCHTPSSPLHLLPYASLLQSGVSHVPSMSEVTGAFMRHVWRSAATCQVPLWLSWRQHVDDDDSENLDLGGSESLKMGPALLHTPLQTLCLFRLLYTPSQQTRQSSKGDRDTKKVTASKVTTAVPLGQYLEKVEQLRVMMELMWSNATALSTDLLNFRSNGVKHLLLSLSQLFVTLEPFLLTSDLNAWKSTLDDVITAVTSVDTDQTVLRSSLSVLEEYIARSVSASQNVDDDDSAGKRSKVVLDEVGPDLKAALICIMDILSFKKESVSEGGIVFEKSDDQTMECDPMELDLAEEKAEGPKGGRNHLIDLLTLGKGWTHLGLLEVQLLAPRGPVDPAEKKALKLQYVKNEMSDLTNQLRVRSLASELLTGRTLQEVPPNQLPERVRLAQTRLELLQERAPELAKETAYRPEPPKFDALLKDVTHYLTSIGSRSTVEGLLNKLTATFDTLSADKSGGTVPYPIKTVLSEEKAWQNSQFQFLRKIEGEYPLYRDQWAGLVTAVMQMQYGIRLIAHALYSLSERGHFSERGISSEASLGLLAEFPICSERQAVTGRTLQLVKSLASYSAIESEPSAYPKLKMSLLLLSLVHSRNQAFLAGHLAPKTCQDIFSILDRIVTSWRQAQDAARRKEEEAASLYKFKAKTHGDGLTDEQREEKEFRQSFPSFEKDFADIVAEPSLERTPDAEKEDPDETTATTPQLTQQQMHQVYSIHRELFTELVQTGWIQIRSHSNHIDERPYREVLENGYSTMVQLYDKVLPFMDSSLDSKLIGAHLLMSHSLYSALTQPDKSSDTERQQPYDIYHDGNIKEAVQCRPLLEGFNARISELMEEWPEHPTLKQLVMLIDRILEFPIKSPLMKFVTGLEILLEKAQEWEGNASRKVSVRDHLEKLTGLVIQWRKLELRCWSACLDTVVHRQEQSATKWWFHIYQLVQSHLCSEATVATSDQDGRQHNEGDETEGEVEGIGGVIAALQRFMEGSSLGEFSTRLQILYSFHCQTAMQPSSSKQLELQSILWNLHCYYKQFLSAVEAEIKSRRAPIEKELKGYVKIARWNDINFWSVKIAVEKSHKTLHKFSKKFETELKEPSKCVFTDGKIAEKEEISAVESLGTASRTYNEFLTPEVYKSYIGDIPPSATTLKSDSSLHARLSSLLPRMTKLCRSFFKKCPYPALTTAVDEFTGEIVSGVKELQGLDITKDADKDKQKSQVRRIQQRKRKALADLFRYLTTIGLSYRKGLAVVNTSNQNEALMVPPIDLAVALDTKEEGVNLNQSEMVRLWEGCQSHYVKSIARRAALQMSLAVPSKELGVGNIERCKGFTEHLTQLAAAQRRQITDITQGIVDTRSFLCQLQQLKPSADCHGNNPLIPPQQSTASWVMTLKGLVDNIRETTLQYGMLLDACPERDGGATDVLSPLPREHLARIDTVRKGDALWVETRNKLQECQTVLETVSQRVLPRANRISKQDLQLIFWNDVELLDESVEELQIISAVLADIEQLFCLPQGVGKSSLATSLISARERLLKMLLEYGQWRRWIVCCIEEEADQDKMDMGSSELLADFESRSESLLASILLVVQSMVKTQTIEHDDVDDGQQAAGDKEEDQEEFFDLQDGHLVKHLSSALSKDVMTLDLGLVSKVTRSLLQDLKETRDRCQSVREIREFNNCVILVLRLVPVLHQYLGLVSFTLNQSVACHRTTCKLLSVLLGIFTELAAKGFCLPAEFSDELGGEGATDFQDIEEGGIGEGEGMKDVSDQIENEDQIQDTKKQGEKEDEEDFSNQPDLKDEEHGIEMSDDFQGKLHDGEPQDGEESDQDNDEEHEMEKQMGDVDQPGADMLDERMWGDEEDEEEGKDGEEEKKKKEEFGEGKGEESRTDMVAKDDNQGAEDDKGDDEKEGKEGQEESGENNEDQKPNNLEPKDEGDYNDDEVDPRKANEPPEAPVPDDLDIPDDLNLDGGKMDEENPDGETENQDETNPFDIETKLPDEKGHQDEMDEQNEQEEDTGGQEEGDQDEARKEEEEAGGDGAEEEKIGGEEDAGGMEQEDGDGNDQEDDGEEQGGGVGVEPQDEDGDEPIPEDSNADYKPDLAHHPQAMPEPAENYGKSQEKTETMQEQATQEDAGKSEEEKNKEKENVGTAESSLQEGHEGAVPSKTLPRENKSEQRQNYKRQPGQSDADRSLGSADERVHKRLRTTEALDDQQDKTEEQGPNDEQAEKDETSDLYEHIKDATSRYDTQMMDAASEDQLMEEQPVPNQEEEDAAAMETDEEVVPLDEDGKEKDDSGKIETVPGSKIKAGERRAKEDESDEPNPDVTQGGEAVDGTASGDASDISKMQGSTIHTSFDLLSHDATPQSFMNMEELETLRLEMEQQLSMLSQKQGTAEEEREAQETWHRYESLTSGLARDLCEQLRLVLEPTRASKLRGDFRTGKRINMRKVIPYIASGFRKDKIWLRRTKPSKRQYQILLAVDDSSSMADNRSRQLAFESLAVISNALTWLEAGELAVCSFGESVQLLHPFHEQFTDQSGAKILRQFTFSQTKTKIGQLLNYATASMLSARSRLQTSGSSMETSQLLLVVSDGRGLFLEGMEKVKAAVREARDANVFLVFLALDNPENKDSILDIKVPIFGGAGELPQISTYMEHFPFPFYIILKDINSMPETLSDALRQWFELVTAGDIK